MKLSNIVAAAVLLAFCQAAFAQDIIVTKNAKRFQVNVLEVSASTIKYTEFDNPNGPIMVVPVTDVESVIYVGDEEDFDEFSRLKTDDSKVKPRYGSARKDSSERPFLLYPRFHIYIDGGFTYNSKYKSNGLELRTILGSQLGDYVFLGAGLGITAFIDRTLGTSQEEWVLKEGSAPQMVDCYDKIPRYDMTALANMKLTLPITSKVVPFAELEAGFDILKRDWTDEWFPSWHFGLGIGLSLSHVTLSAGYKRFTLPVDREVKPHDKWSFYKNGRENGSVDFGNFYVRIGMKIGYLKD